MVLNYLRICCSYMKHVIISHYYVSLFGLSIFLIRPGVYDSGSVQVARERLG
jgi:hypothetical protein